jgi:hypothetical protein
MAQTVGAQSVMPVRRSHILGSTASEMTRSNRQGFGPSFNSLYGRRRSVQSLRRTSKKRHVPEHAHLSRLRAAGRAAHEIRQLANGIVGSELSKKRLRSYESFVHSKLYVIHCSVAHSREVPKANEEVKEHRGHVQTLPTSASSRFGCCGMSPTQLRAQHALLLRPAAVRPIKYTDLEGDWSSTVP